MANTPWYTSSDLIESVKRKISTPTYQSMLSEDDILKFCNEEMKDSMIPNILRIHEEYFVSSEGAKLKPNVSRYSIPNRAIGMKLRDLFYGDGQPLPELPFGTLSELVRVNADDKAYFDGRSELTTLLAKYYLEGNDIVLVPKVGPSPIGYLVFYYFFRPNQLVLEDRAHVISNFTKNIVVTNSNIQDGDTVTFEFTDDTDSIQSVSLTAVAGVPTDLNQFQIGVGSATTGSNLTTAINNHPVLGLYFTADNGTPATATVKIDYSHVSFSISASKPLALLVSARIGLESTTAVPANITERSYIDILQTLPGHKTLKYDVVVPVGGISANVLYLNPSDVGENVEIGDYICSRNECIIPQIPTELHSALAERAAARILASQGDREALAESKDKIAELETKEPTLLSNRVEGSAQTVFNKFSLLRLKSRRRGNRL